MSSRQLVIVEGPDRRLRVPAGRPPGDGNPGNDDDNNGTGGPPIRANLPDITFQLRIPQFLPNGLVGDEQDLIANELLRQSRQNGYTNAEVLFNFDNASRTIQIGVWLLGPGTGFDDAKKEGLRLTIGTGSLNDLTNFAISVNSGTIEREVDRRWSSGEIPRHYDSDGNPCSGEDCDIDLDGVHPYFTDLDQPFNPRRDRLYTIVGGKYTPAFPDVDFTVTVTDIFTIEDGRIAITSSTSVDTDTSIFNVLTAVFLFIGAIFTAEFGIGAGILPFLAGTFFGVEDGLIHLLGDAKSPGIGQFVVETFFPGELKFPGLPTIPLIYQSIEAGGAVMTATGRI